LRLCEKFISYFTREGEKLPRTADTGGFLNLQLQVGVLRIALGFLKTEACTPQSDYTNSQFLIVGSRISYPARA